jgi:Bardet-Biedl syndrome 2 protein
VETEVSVPRFASFAQLKDDSNLPSALKTSGVAFEIVSSAEQFGRWLESGFLLMDPVVRGDKVKAVFVSIFPTSTVSDESVDGGRGGRGESVVILAKEEGSGGGLRVTIRCESMALASDLVQDLGRHFKLSELETAASFPSDMARFKDVLQTVADCNAARTHLTADMAEEAQRLKALIVKAEDSRILSDIASMRRAFTDLYSVNATLMAGYKSRSSNHQGLLAALKEVNLTIQRAANLRIGASKAHPGSESRAAVKANNMPALLRIIETGGGS